MRLGNKGRKINDFSVEEFKYLSATCSFAGMLTEARQDTTPWHELQTERVSNDRKP